LRFDGSWFRSGFFRPPIAVRVGSQPSFWLGLEDVVRVSVPPRRKPRHTANERPGGGKKKREGEEEEEARDRQRIAKNMSQMTR
jgi:hypothetical protein